MSLALTRLLQLASPALPVGAYTYSQGLEWAVEAGTVQGEATALTWIGDQLEWNLGRFETPLLASMLAAWKVGAHETALELDAQYLASRESAELRAETVQMGYSLRRLLDELRDLPDEFMAQIAVPPAPTFAWVWSGVAACWNIPPADAVTAWLWSWAENQTMAALKSVPLGQAAGQRILLEIGRRIPDVAAHALTLGADQYSNFAPGFAIACCRHETQYTRLFRS
ncbi:MAG: urease accessory protein UreF [Gammaproteobacteria bacterium]|nr:urease accessory protein UreF [Rhodocyclaceae bacterium]MBU3909200.1 urease accessory protein UreF [Gammaproteobacteria bacterium]MBU3989988.1 urease accessory protein UreF [Gammaproteobacteria bacterium]MBU4005640.1 urease accessory protein UreF [Gammaproteobacteria bacterium]MBU4020807.1 urease accessory protein UreF [Gammaproteobacteria bacterium]